MGADKSHLRFRVGGSIRAVDFGAGDLAEGLSAAQKVKVAFHLATNTYKGNTSLQLMVQDIQMQSDQVIDMRMPQLTQSQVAGAHTYVFFNPRLAKQLTQRLQFGGPTVMANQLTTGTTDVVLVDLPSSEAELAATVQRVDLPVGALFFAPAKQILAIPSRNEFGAVLRFLGAHPRFDKHQLPMVARATHLDTSQVIFAVQVFLQLKFVTIDDGVFISTVSHPQKQALEDAPVYQERVAQLGLARRLRTASRADLRATLLRYRQEL
ncbi:single-stranded-DNA-specific exonuclease C-terminal domain-containing protein [Lacticaseibacillus pantheris]|nr:single-stranded-DNA-specific exonuclease C-terminal domain-containing protein [Lacticaseibacillus pantheris]